MSSRVAVSEGCEADAPKTVHRSHNGWTPKITQMLCLWLRQFQVNQKTASEEAEKYETIYTVLNIIQAITAGLAVVESLTAAAQFNGNETVLLAMVIGLVVTSCFGAVANVLVTTLKPDERAKTARTMAAEHSILARRIDVQFQLSVTSRRNASQVVYEIMDRYDGLVSQNSVVRLDKDLPNISALNAWFSKKTERDAGTAPAAAPHHIRRQTPDEWREEEEHARSPSPSRAPSRSPSPSRVSSGGGGASLSMDSILQQSALDDQDFLQRDQRSKAIMAQLDYQMSRLVEHDL
jgi:hypothetical protein